jgi:hypothetical protein
MSDELWRACIDELRSRGYRIVESIVTKGDRAGNEVGYTLIGEPPATGATGWWASIGEPMSKDRRAAERPLYVSR